MMLDSIGKVVSTTLAVFVFCSEIQAEALDCDWQADRRVTVADGWIEVEQGRDESGETLRLAIWGPEAIEAVCAQLDSDPEPEVVVTSRGLGTGPYYRLQIVDYHSQGIMTWAYSSDGAPKVEDRVISLGKLVDGYQGAGSVPTYSEYRLIDEGLIDLGAETSWFLIVTVTFGEMDIQLPLTDQQSRETCEFTAQNLVAEFAEAGQTASYSCVSNLEIEGALAPFIN